MMSRLPGKILKYFLLVIALCKYGRYLLPMFLSKPIRWILTIYLAERAGFESNHVQIIMLRGSINRAGVALRRNESNAIDTDLL